MAGLRVSCCSSSLTGDQALKARSAAVSGGGDAEAAPLAELGRRSALRVGERPGSRGAGAVAARMGEWEGGVRVEVEEEVEVEVGCWQGGMKSWRE